MIEYDLAIGAGAVADAWLVALVVLRGRRPWLQSTFAAFGLTLVVNAAAFVGTDAGWLPSVWEAAVFGTLVLLYPLAAILVLGLIHGESLPRRKPVVFLLLAGVPVFVLATPTGQWTAEVAYDPNPLGFFLGTCLGIALAEPLYQKLTSRLRSRDVEWLLLGVLILAVGGPVYTIEFGLLNLPVAAGSNLAAPVALAFFGVVALRTAPYPASLPRGTSAWSGDGGLVRGQTYVFDERRPAFAIRELSQEAYAGRPTLLIARSSAPPESEAAALPVARIVPGRHVASRVMATASEFLARFPGGLVGLADVGDVALLSNWAATREMLAGLRGVAKGTHGTIVLDAACLTRSERRDLREMKFAWWTLPDPAEELEAVLGRSFGPGAKQILSRFAVTRGLRPSELTADDVPALTEFVGRAVLSQDAPVADPVALEALRRQAESAVGDLRAFASRPTNELAQGDWPSRAATHADSSLVVTPDAYWAGREVAAPAPSGVPVAARPSFFERARAVFVEHLGPAGEGVLLSEMAKLGRRPQELGAQDVARLADRAAVDLSAMADVVDLPQEKVRIQRQIESIRRGLETIAGVES